MVKIGEKTVVSVTCQEVILQLAERHCTSEEYLHFGRKEARDKYVLVTDAKIYMITSKAGAGAKHKEDVFSIQYTKMQKKPLRMKFEGWTFEMPTDSIDPAADEWTNHLTAEINCLKEILAEGIITEEEFERAKDRLKKN